MCPLSENINRVSPKMGLQGPRPSVLKVCKDSYTKKIKKPPAGHHHRRSEVVIHHLKSPKIFHTRPQDFMLLVQQLTGNNKSSSLSTSSSTSSTCYSTTTTTTTTQICGLTVTMMGDEYMNCSDMKSCKGFDEGGEEKKEEYLTIPLPSTPSPGFFIW